MHKNVGWTKIGCDFHNEKILLFFWIYCNLVVNYFISSIKNNPVFIQVFDQIKLKLSSTVDRKMAEWQKLKELFTFNCTAIIKKQIILLSENNALSANRDQMYTHIFNKSIFP